VVESDRSMGVSQLLEGHVPGLPPKVYDYALCCLSMSPKVIYKTIKSF